MWAVATGVGLLCKIIYIVAAFCISTATWKFPVQQRSAVGGSGMLRDIEGGSPGMVGGTVRKAVCAAVGSALSAVPLCIPIDHVQYSCFWGTDGGVSKKGDLIFLFTG